MLPSKRKVIFQCACGHQEEANISTDSIETAVPITRRCSECGKTIAGVPDNDGPLEHPFKQY